MMIYKKIIKDYLLRKPFQTFPSCVREVLFKKISPTITIRKLVKIWKTSWNSSQTVKLERHQVYYIVRSFVTVVHVICPFHKTDFIWNFTDTSSWGTWLISDSCADDNADHYHPCVPGIVKRKLQAQIIYIFVVILLLVQSHDYVFKMCLGNVTSFYLRFLSCYVLRSSTKLKFYVYHRI